jgi:serine/threonine-protein kinase
MELLEGESLRDRLDKVERIPWTRAVTIARQVASALGAAHELGVVHRDLKPDNVFLVEDPAVVGGERAKVLDFGIAKLSEDTGVANVFRTRTGSLIGTPVYMSPEQCRGAGEVDERTDIYSLGCVLYQMVCGSPPFIGAGYGDLITMHMTVPPPPPRMLEPTVPAWLEQVILRMLAKNPDDRYGDMSEVTTDLDNLLVMPAVTPIPSGSSRLASGTPAPPTTLAMSASERVVALGTMVPAAPVRRRWSWVVWALGVIGAGALSFALAAGLGQEDKVAPALAAPSPVVEVPDVAEAAPEPPPPAPAPVVTPPAEVAPAEVAPADAGPPPTGRKARAKKPRKKPVEEPPAPRTDRKPRVRGGIAEPNF